MSNQGFGVESEELTEASTGPLENLIEQRRNMVGDLQHVQSLVTEAVSGAAEPISSPNWTMPWPC